MAVVAHLARMSETREALAHDDSLVKQLEYLEWFSHGAAWVSQAILRTSGTLVVLYPATAQGLIVEYSNVARCFHLFSLLQSCIGRRLPGGKEPDPVVAAAARGESNEPCSDSAWWHFADSWSKTPEFSASIWGEALVRSLSIVEGRQVLLLWPPILKSRSWDSGFFGPHLAALPSNATVQRTLEPEECNQWLATLGIQPAPSPKRRWRFW